MISYRAAALLPAFLDSMQQSLPGGILIRLRPDLLITHDGIGIFTEAGFLEGQGQLTVIATGLVFIEGEEWRIEGDSSLSLLFTRLEAENPTPTLRTFLVEQFQREAARG